MWGMYFPKTVRMYAVEQSGGQDVAREILYDPSYFAIPPGNVAAQLPVDPVAHGRLLGARAEGRVRGLAQGRALDHVPGRFLFPRQGRAWPGRHVREGDRAQRPAAVRPRNFRTSSGFWFAPAPAGSKTVTVYALLDGPSVAGAYRFVMERTKGVVMEIEAALYFRQAVERLGLAPLTTMFWYSETVKQAGIDWRPEVHDSDGLAMWTGGGEHIWRPLNNPAHITVSAFQDEHPRGFGLLQRDRNFDHYLDGVGYEKRPSTWVEPMGDWGKGSRPARRNPDRRRDQRQHHRLLVPGKARRGRRPRRASLPPALACGRALPDAARPLRGHAPRPRRTARQAPPRSGVRKFDVEFLGGPLSKTLPYGVKPELVLWSSRGEFTYTYAEAVPDDVPGHWRALFDLTVDGNDPVEMRLYLKAGDQVLTETWLYQYRPFTTISYPVGY